MKWASLKIEEKLWIGGLELSNRMVVFTNRKRLKTCQQQKLIHHLLSHGEISVLLGWFGGFDRFVLQWVVLEFVVWCWRGITSIFIGHINVSLVKKKTKKNMGFPKATPTRIP